mgnify:CR=1 FL=1
MHLLFIITDLLLSYLKKKLKFQKSFQIPIFPALAIVLSYFYTLATKIKTDLYLTISVL